MWPRHRMEQPPASKGGNSDPSANVDAPRGHRARRDKPSREALWVFLWQVPAGVKSTDAGSRRWAPGPRATVPADTGFHWGLATCSGPRQR